MAATQRFPTVTIGDQAFSRVMLGHNPFLGYSYFSEATARYYHEKFADGAAIEAVIGAALEAGVRGMMLSLDSPRGESIVAALERAGEACGVRIPTIAILGADFEQLGDLIRRANVQAGVLHGQITDALFRKGTRDFAPEFDQYMVRMRAIGLIPGASTHNGGETVPAMAGRDVVVINTPVNKIGWRMCPCPEQVLSALARADQVVIAMKPLAMGRIPPAEGMEYALSRPEVDIVLAGAASPAEVEETFGAAARAVEAAGAGASVAAG
jgi:hypothetical protein